MKIIDLLNKIANGEEVPKIIKYNNTFYEFDKELNDYTCSGYRLFGNELEESYKLIEHLNDEVEIIEDNKKIEKIDVDWQNVFDEQAQQDFAKMTLNKINEIINKLNKEE